MNYPAVSRDGKVCIICNKEIQHDAAGKTVHKTRRGHNGGKDCLKRATLAAQRRMAS